MFYNPVIIIFLTKIIHRVDTKAYLIIIVGTLVSLKRESYDNVIFTVLKLKIKRSYDVTGNSYLV